MSTPALLSKIVSGRCEPAFAGCPPPPRLVHDPQRPACVRGEGRVSKEGRGRPRREYQWKAAWPRWKKKEEIRRR